MGPMAFMHGEWLAGIDNETLIAGILIVLFGLPWIAMWHVVKGERAKRAQQEHEDRMAIVKAHMLEYRAKVDLLEWAKGAAQDEALQKELDEARRHAANGVADEEEPERGIA